jgi:hypothetical protein
MERHNSEVQAALDILDEEIGILTSQGLLNRRANMRIVRAALVALEDEYYNFIDRAGLDNKAAVRYIEELIGKIKENRKPMDRLTADVVRG